MVNLKNIKQGDLVYVITGVFSDSKEKVIRVGIVDYVYSDGASMDFLTCKDRRIVCYEDKKIPINELIKDKKELHKVRKLPKGWTWNTNLVNMETEKYDDEFATLSLDNPERILEAYNKGLLIKSADYFHGYIDCNIDKNGWTLKIEYNSKWGIHAEIDSGVFNCDKVFNTYEEAKKVLDNEKKEIERIANLSDEEWSKEQIDKTLKHYQGLYKAEDKEINAYREYLFSKDNVEDIETRIFDGVVQWKHWKNKKWNNLTLDMII